MMKNTVFKFIKEFCIGRRFIVEYVLVSGLIMTNTLLSLLAPKYQAEIIDVLSHARSNIHISSFIKLLLVYISLYSLTYIIEYLKKIKIVKVAENISVDIRCKMNEKLEKIEIEYFEKFNSAQILSLFNREIQIIKKSGIIMFINLFNNIIIIFLVIPVMFKVDFMITLIIMVLLCIYCISNKVFSKALENSSRSFFDANEKLNTNIQDNFNNWMLTRFFKTEYFTKDVFNIKNENYKFQSIRQEKYYLRNTYFSVFIILLCISFAWIFGGYQVIKMCMTVGEVILIINYLNLILGPINYISNFINEYNMVKIAIEKLYDFLEYKEEISLEKIYIDNVQSITFNNVSFEYDGKKILHDNCLEFEKGKIYAIRGKSGSGKSTIIKILLGIKQVDWGGVLINGRDIKKIYLKSYRSRISYITGATQFFHGSILNNIKISSTADINKIMNMCKKMDIYRDIIAMKSGYNAEIDNAHSNISDGQAKRIELVRNFLANPNVIIIDEGLYVLDKKRRDIVYQYLFEHKNDTIIIIVTHNDHEIEDVDVEYILQNGNIITIEH